MEDQGKPHRGDFGSFFTCCIGVKEGAVKHAGDISLSGLMLSKMPKLISLSSI